MTKQTIEPQGDSIIVRRKKQDGKDTVSTFLDRRSAVTWPGPNNKGYFAVFGLSDQRNASGQNVLYLINEKYESNRRKLFEIMAAYCAYWHCKWLFADMSTNYDSFVTAFTQFANQRKAKHPVMFDAAEWKLENSVPIITEWLEAKRLKASDKSLLKPQVSSMQSVDLHTQERITATERFPAVNALQMILNCYEVYPYRKKHKNTPNEGRREGYA